MKAKLIAKDKPGTDLIASKIDQARILLLSARDARDAKQIADMARAAEVYARRQKLSEEIIGHAYAIKIDAMTRMGEFLKTAEKNTGSKSQLKGKDSSGGPLSGPPETSVPTLEEVGITKNESSTAQTLSEMKKTNPELHEQVRTGQVTVKAAVTTVKRQNASAARQAVAARLVAEAKDDSLFRVDQADCLDWFAAQPADSIHMVFGSPPYENARLYLEDGADPGIARDADDWVEWMVQVYKAALRCCSGLVAFVVEGQTLIADTRSSESNLAVGNLPGLPATGSARARTLPCEDVPSSVESRDSSLWVCHAT